jgi:plasmid stabilization system protein ParE
MPRLILTSEAIEDLARVRDFLAEKSQEAADRAKGVIVEHLEKVQRFPTAYRPVLGQRDQREIVIAFGTYGYVMRYHFDQEGNTVTILRVWHQRENNSFT